jgi:hypothetical protein
LSRNYSIFETLPNLPDIGKIQLLLFTTMTFIAYIALLNQAFNKIPASFNLPELSSGITSLLAISNLGYLAYRAVPHSTNGESYLWTSTEESQTTLRDNNEEIKSMIKKFKLKISDTMTKIKETDLFLLGLYALQTAIIAAVLYALVLFPSWLKSLL